MTSRRLRDAWDEVYGALSEGWVVQRPSYRPSEGTWAGSARDARPPADERPAPIEAYGADETSCLLALAQQLRLRSAGL
jgi:hypothetical protein